MFLSELIIKGFVLEIKVSNPKSLLKLAEENQKEHGIFQKAQSLHQELGNSLPSQRRVSISSSKVLWACSAAESSRQPSNMLPSSHAFFAKTKRLCLCQCSCCEKAGSGEVSESSLPPTAFYWGRQGQHLILLTGCPQHHLSAGSPPVPTGCYRLGVKWARGRCLHSEGDWFSSPSHRLILCGFSEIP